MTYPNPVYRAPLRHGKDWPHWSNLCSTFFVVKSCGEVYRVFILHQSCFLHETLVFCVEYIVHQVIFEQSAHPYATHQQTDIAHRECEDIERSRFHLTNGQSQQPPIEKEKDEAWEKHCPNLRPCYFLLLHAFCSQTWESKKYYSILSMIPSVNCHCWNAS